MSDRRLKLHVAGTIATLSGKQAYRTILELLLDLLGLRVPYHSVERPKSLENRLRTTSNSHRGKISPN